MIGSLPDVSTPHPPGARSRPRDRRGLSWLASPPTAVTGVGRKELSRAAISLLTCGDGYFRLCHAGSVLGRHACRSWVPSGVSPQRRLAFLVTDLAPHHGSLEDLAEINLG